MDRPYDLWGVNVGVLEVANVSEEYHFSIVKCVLQ